MNEQLRRLIRTNNAKREFLDTGYYSMKDVPIWDVVEDKSDPIDARVISHSREKGDERERTE